MRVLILSVLALAAALGGCRALSAEDRAIDDLTRRMTERVRAGDADGYLELVDMSDPHFAAEQRAWAASLDDDRAPQFRVEREEAALRVRWRPVAGAEPRDLWFFPRFTRGADGVLRYAGPAWVEAPNAGRFRVLAPPGTRDADRAVRALARAAPEVDKLFGGVPADPPPVTLYPTMPALQLSISPTYSAPLSGWHEPGESIRVLWDGSLDDGEVAHVIAHELAHARHFALAGPNDRTPWWVYEGVAELASGRVVGGFDRVDTIVRTLAADGKLARFEDLATFDAHAFDGGWVAYPQGHHMVRYLVGRFGERAVFEWVRRMGDGETLEQATNGAFGRTFASIDSDWRATLG